MDKYDLKNLQDIKFNPEIKIAEGLSHFGVYPQDFFIQAQYLKKKYKNILVVGIRSAGSYYAPPVCTALKVNSYFTVRPRFVTKFNKREIYSSDSEFSLFMTPDEITKFRTGILRSEIVVIADEGPGTGLTFKETAKK